MDHFVWNLDPVLISFMGLKVHWYGALFALAIASGFQVMKRMYKKEGLDVESLDNLLMYCVVGIIVGARLAHCFFYDPSYYFANPMKILAIWEGGLASHGGGLGAILALYYYKRKTDMPFLFLLDRLAIATAIFGFFVRMANFANSEILGLPTTKPWGIIFERVDLLPRHPAQLYEAISYLVIFISLYAVYKFTNLKEKHGVIFGLFLCSVFSARWAIEMVKVKQAAYATEWTMSAGQLLSIPFLVVGIALLILPMLKKNK
ncbi:prolipoprotein diacylglyceryl transferase [Shewanella sp. 10N.286.51.B7]|uniref:Phosphatidylglycerol--prolipoprotein diacylglyceryl transferase n=1 Tax=Shewanella electrodiphila TaxID=934143 RepID=A0ABT0KUJ0_9GAMM|nr:MULTISPECIES: prolipoprotein diacylglyceryl transferase [unclassified Shewanella]MCC4833492.1 prolipoprotein diacylglyceryl transferase [Shewanella sp. 10N.7]MCL1047449.1 prolipoprotein diacylglyceryl transferase [Shewanella electrodiphila]PMG79025.1 prolipoprotein diacylglyceryl transferase [Shewanella sp. 10N.286.51.B7]